MHIDKYIPLFYVDIIISLWPNPDAGVPFLTDQLRQNDPF